MKRFQCVIRAIPKDKHLVELMVRRLEDESFFCFALSFEFAADIALALEQCATSFDYANAAEWWLHVHGGLAGLEE